MTIAEELVQLKVGEYRTNEKLNKLLKTLDIRMSMFAASGSAKEIMGKRDGVLGKSIRVSTSESQYRKNQPAQQRLMSDVRLASYDLNSLLKGSPRAFKPVKGSGARDAGINPPLGDLGKHRKSIQSTLESYLQNLLRGPLGEHSDLTQHIANYSKGYQAIVSLDYYSDRPSTAVGLHKDTTGNTLFVALHYLNISTMLGPEYVNDIWPVDAQENDKSELFRNTFWRGQKVQGTKRSRAPWSKTSNKQTFWPTELLKELEAARKVISVEGNDTLQYITLQPFGLIAFVDELIYHTTPLGGHRGKSTLFATATASKARHAVLPKDVKRRISIDLNDKKKLADVKGGMENRSFIRLWISIVPNGFYVPLD